MTKFTGYCVLAAMFLIGAMSFKMLAMDFGVHLSQTLFFICCLSAVLDLLRSK